MTDHPVQGLAEESSAGFVNGSARPAATARPSAKIRTARTTAHHDEPKQDGPAAPIWDSSPAYWRQACPPYLGIWPFPSDSISARKGQIIIGLALQPHSGRVSLFLSVQADM